MKALHRQRAQDLILAAVISIGIYVAVRKLFFLVFPLLLALTFSQVIRNGFARLNPISEGVKKILIVLSLLIFFSFISLLGILLVDRLIHSLTALSQGISSHLNNLLSFCENLIHRAEGFFSDVLNRNLENSLTDYLPSLFEQFLQKMMASFPNWIASLAGFVPRFMISLFIFVIATYYFSCDWNRLSRPFVKKMKPETLEKIKTVKQNFFSGLKQYLKAYLLLFLLTFSELFLGLTVLKVSGAAEKAFVIALVDLLPIFGCGTVLIPWSLVSFVMGKTSFCIGILVLYLILFAVRQVMEPKIVGESIGLHPVFSLVLVITGLALFGFFGMLLLPLIATCFLESSRERA